MNQVEITALLSTLKSVLRRKKLTYKKIADQLGLSEVSVKRVFSDKDCSLSRLSQICAMADLSIFELSEITKSQSEKENYFLSKEQEIHFSKHPKQFAVFRQLYRGDKAKIVCDDWGIDEVRFFKVLRQFEKLDLIELHPNNTYKFKISGRLRINLQGPLFRNVIKKQNQDFLENVYNRVTEPECSFQSSDLQLSRASLLSMVRELNDLGKKYRAQSYLEERTLDKKSLVDVRWLFALLPYSTDWKKL